MKLILGTLADEAVISGLQPVEVGQMIKQSYTT